MLPEGTVALYENAVPFELQRLEGPDSPAARRLAELWPMKRFPVLVHGERTILEASCIVEYVGLQISGPVRLIPADSGAAPFLFYAHWTQPIGDAHPHVTACRRRSLQRPSFARAVDEERPYRPFFPLGAPPDRA